MAGAALLALLAGHAAHADSTWINASGGNWGLTANWNNGNVPDNTGESAIILPAGPYTVFLDNNYNINTLTIAHALARVDLQNNLFLGLAGGLDTTGVLTINNAGGPNQTSIRVLGSQSWIGSGKVVLNANAGNLDTAFIYFNGGGEVLTLGSGKEILGSGRIYVNTVNNGGIIADTFGRTLELISQPKANNNEFAAINGGTLQITQVGVTQGASGSIRAFTGSAVSILSSQISGGQIATNAGGFTRFTGTSTITDVATSGNIDVVNNSSLQLSSSVTNDGDLRVNDGSSGNNTFIRVISNTALGGIGSLTLRSDGSNLDTAYLFYNGGGEILTQGAQHTIRGSGNIYVGMVNNGTISASTAGRTLRLTGFTKVNNKTIAADTGRLEIEGVAITQGPSGVISLSNVAGASLNYRNSTVSSGTVQSVVNSSTSDGTSTFTNTFINGPFTVLNNSEMRLSGAGTTHSGDLFVNSGSGANNTYIRILENHTISGNGRIVLRSNGSNLDTAYLLYNGGSEVLTQALGHSIVGTGNIHVALNNAGLVSADQNGKALGLVAFAKTNTGVMRAIGGGILQSGNTSITQTGSGVIRSDASLFQSITTTINGGLIESINAGVFEFNASTTLNNVTLAGAGRVPNNNELRIGGGTLINNSTLTVNPTAGANGTYIRVLQDEALSGTGSIVLNANPGSLDTAYIVYNGGNETLTQSSGHSIRGTGRVYVKMTNNGLVSANSAGKTLELLGFAKANNSIFEATSGGTLQISAAAVTQAPGGLIRSTSGGLLSFVTSSITGGTIQSASSSLSDAAAFNASSTLSGVTLVGAAKVPNNNELRIDTGIVNNSILTINATAGGNGTYMKAVNSSQITGTGSIVLNANPGSFDTAYLVYNGGGEVLTLGSGQTLAGSGNIYVRTISNALVAPGGNPNGTEIGRLNLPGFRFTQTPSGIMAFQIAGPTPAEFDRITGSATMDLAGALVPSIINGYDPAIGTSYDIIDGPVIVGEFATVAPRFAAQYFPNKVRVIYTGVACPADLNHDDVVDDADFVLFVPAYNILDCGDPNMPAGCPADMNRDGIVNDTDFVIFLSQYNELICPV